MHRHPCKKKKIVTNKDSTSSVTIEKAKNVVCAQKKATALVFPMSKKKSARRDASSIPFSNMDNGRQVGVKELFKAHSDFRRFTM